MTTYFDQIDLVQFRPGASYARLEENLPRGEGEEYLLRLEIAHVDLAPRGRRPRLIHTSGVQSSERVRDYVLTEQSILENIIDEDFRLAYWSFEICQ